MRSIFRQAAAMCLLILSATQAWSQSPADILVSGNFSRVPLVAVFHQLESEYGIHFYYKNGWLDRDTVSLRISARPLPEVVRTLLDNRPYTFRILNGNEVVVLPKDEVAMLTGEMVNYSGTQLTDDLFTLVGSQAEAGRLKAASLTGKVMDGKSGEPIIGATVQVNNMQLGAVTNTQGSYKLGLAPGMYTLVVSSVGFEKALFNVKILSHGELNFELFDKSVALDDIIIYGQRVDRNVSGRQMSLVELDTKAIKQLPSVAGGKDILKGLTTMPGVKSVGEFSSGINVRGGGEDQNLYLVNSAPLFNTSHVFGLFSVINPDMVDRLTLYKGHIPASFGERVSSVVDIKTKESAPAKTRARGGIGLYDSRLMVEVPIYKDKVYFDLGGRTSYSDWLLKRMKDYNLKNSRASFYDVSSSLHMNFGKSRLTLSAYTSHDEFRFANEVSYSYGSRLGSLNWNYLINSNLGSYLTMSYSKYESVKDDLGSSLMQSRTKSGITYGGLKYRLKYGGLNKHTIDAGFSLNGYQVQPGVLAPLNAESLVTSAKLMQEQGYEGAVFLNDEFSLNDFLSFNIGLRYSAYANAGPGNVATYQAGASKDTSAIIGYTHYGNNEIIQFYHGFEPRLSVLLKLSQESSVKMSYNRNMQYISLVSYSSVSTPSDIWKLADPFVKPLIANQFAIGYYHNLFNNTIETSVELYYKGLSNVLDYKNGASLEMNNHIETQLVNTTGTNYGAEFLVRKNSGKVDGWITYTYSRSLRKTNGTYLEDMINGNSTYPSSYDRPHDFTVVANYHINKRLHLSANFTYATGRPVTLPEYKYFSGNEVVVYFSEKNKYRIPDYHRLDLTLSFDESLRLKKKWKGSWSFSLLNVYGRKNAYTIYYKQEDPSIINNYNRFSLYKLYLIGMPLPTLSYSFTF